MEALPGYKTLFEVIKAGGGTRCERERAEKQ